MLTFAIFSMRIAIMSRWNATCGVSVHSELIGREFLRMGHDLIIFSPYSSKDWHHQRIDVSDEKFVIRCYDEDGYINGEEILSRNFDVIIFEGLKHLPINELRKIFDEIKRKAKTVAVIHHQDSKEIDSLYKLDFDAIVVFDERYLNEVVPKEFHKKCFIIPFPFFEGYDVKPKRYEIFSDKILFFSFGKQPVHEYEIYLKVLNKLSNEYDIAYFVIKSYWKMNTGYKWLYIEERRPSLKEIYEYLKGADLHLIPKGHTNKVVVSSTLATTLASLCPVIVPNTRHFEMFMDYNPVLKFNNEEELRMKIKQVIEDDHLKKMLKDRMRKIVKKYSSKKIAKAFLKLFEKI